MARAAAATTIAQASNPTATCQLTSPCPAIIDSRAITTKNTAIASELTTAAHKPRALAGGAEAGGVESSAGPGASV